MFRINFSPFRPHSALPGGNLQTLFSVFNRIPAEPGNVVLHSIPTTLGDHLALHELPPAAESPSNQRQVVMFHGLGGCSQSGYMARISQKLSAAGVRTWRLDARGAGAGVALARYHHHAGRQEDIDAAIRFVAAQQPNCQITPIGFSLGANVLLNWLGQHNVDSDDLSVDSAIAVAPPIDLVRCNREMKQGMARLYDRYFANQMLRRVLERRVARPDMVDPGIRTKPETLAQFDAQFTAPAGGFNTLSEYYDKASTWYKLVDIRIPTLLIVDELDPVIPFGQFEPRLFSSSIEMMTTRGGGHLGYVGKSNGDPDRNWLDWRIVDLVNSLDGSLT